MESRDNTAPVASGESSSEALAIIGGFGKMEAENTEKHINDAVAGVHDTSISVHLQPLCSRS